MVKKRNIAVYPFLVLIILFSFCSCSEESENENKTEELHQAEKSVFAMDTYMTLRAYGENADQALTEAVNEIISLEKLLSVTDEESEIYNLNHAGGKSIPLSETSGYLIDRSLELNRETGGAFDITLYPVSREWGFTTGDYKVPSDERLGELLNNTGSDKVALDQTNFSAILNEGTEIDLGGIAKGYAGRMAAEILRDRGIESALLNMGGNVQTVGSKPDGSGWKVGIKDPENESALVGSLAVSDKAVITSGGYERYFEQDGAVYWHILDPKTGRPTDSGIISATVIGKDGALCDALSTALFVMGEEKAADYLKTQSEVDAVLVTDDHKLYVTSGISESFNPLDDYKYADIIIM